jgi:hypothetical protein
MNYDIDYDQPRVEESEITRDNIRAVSDALAKIQELLNDIDERLKAGGL